MLEPRRVAARAIASRIAEERGGVVGREVGWQIRHDRKTSSDTRLTVVTEGILTARIQSDPFLEAFDIVVLDEFHERSIHTDLALGYCKQIFELRDDFAVVVMSATLDAERIAHYLGCESVVSRGRVHPVAQEWVDRDPEDIASAADSAVGALLRDSDDDGGDILVFMPGVREIEQTIGSMRHRSDLDVLPLHSRLTQSEQDRALRRGPRRKVIVSTNIAETSLTIEGVTAVIDSGLVRIPVVDTATGFDRLETRRVSLASAKQRAGRAGRTAPGRAWKLWPASSEFRMTEYDVADIHRIDLSAAVLDVVAWSDSDPATFPWFEQPPAASLEAAADTLHGIGAIDPDAWSVTDLGTRIGQLPLHPRIAAFLLRAEALGAGRIASLAAACLSEPDWVTSVTESLRLGSDLIWRAMMLEEVASGDTRVASAEGARVSVGGARNALRVARELQRFASSASARKPEEALRRALLAAYSDRLGVRRDGDRYALTTGGSVVLARESAVRDAEMILVLSVFGTRWVDGVSCGLARSVTAIDPSWIEDELGDRITVETHVRFDPALQRVVARRERRLDELVLSYEPTSLGTSTEAQEEIAEALSRAAARDLVSAFGLQKDEARLVERLAFARRWSDREFPDLTDPQTLKPLIWGATSFADLRRLDFTGLARTGIRHDVWQRFESFAPDQYRLPSGRRFRIDYSDPERPVLAAKLQDFFGLYDTPTVADGKVTLLLHLLAPNRRPAQVTMDLRSFWETTYREVRKELRARYPKHDWPEDP